jgi:carbonic anhydrase
MAVRESYSHAYASKALVASGTRFKGTALWDRTRYGSAVPHTWDPNSISPRAAVQRLVEGNRRFCTEGAAPAARTFSPNLAERPQRPFAIVLGCSDSRTPVEILFDEGFGDLFVVRIAGNVVAPSVVGSIEFAASQFGTRLVVVLGHTRCGAITATVNALQTGNGPESRNIQSITNRITPHIEPLVRTNTTPMDAETLRELMRTNVRASADHLRHGSQILEELVSAGRLAVVAAEYEIETGHVRFFDGVPPG